MEIEMATVAQATKHMLRVKPNMRLVDVVAKLNLPDIQNARDLKAQLAIQGTTLERLRSEAMTERNDNYLTIVQGRRSPEFGPSRADSSLIVETLREYVYTHTPRFDGSKLKSITYVVGPLGPMKKVELAVKLSHLEFTTIQAWK